MSTLMVVDGSKGETLTEASARRLREQLAGRRIKQTDLAETLHVSKMWLRRRLNGEVSMSAEDMERIERATGISAAYLVTGHKSAPRPDGPEGDGCATRDSNPQPSDPKVAILRRTPNLRIAS